MTLLISYIIQYIDYLYIRLKMDLDRNVRRNRGILRREIFNEYSENNQENIWIIDKQSVSL